MSITCDVCQKLPVKRESDSEPKVQDAACFLHRKKDDIRVPLCAVHSGREAGEGGKCREISESLGSLVDMTEDHVAAYTKQPTREERAAKAKNAE